MQSSSNSTLLQNLDWYWIFEVDIDIGIIVCFTINLFFFPIIATKNVVGRMFYSWKINLSQLSGFIFMSSIGRHVCRYGYIFSELILADISNYYSIQKYHDDDCRITPDGYKFKIWEAIRMSKRVNILVLFCIACYNEWEFFTMELHTEKHWRSVFLSNFSRMLSSISSECPLGRLWHNYKLKLCRCYLLTSGNAETGRGEIAPCSDHSYKTQKTRLDWLYTRMTESCCQGVMLSFQARKVFWTLTGPWWRPCLLVPLHLSVDASISRQNKHQDNLLSCINAPQRHSPQLRPSLMVITLHQWTQSCSSIYTTAGTDYGCTTVTPSQERQ